MSNKNVLFIGYVWPEPKTTAAGHRMLQLLHCFKTKNFEVTFATTAQKSSYSVVLSKYGITTKSILLNDSSFDNFVRQLNPDLVVLDRFMVEEQFGWRVAENCPKALRILNTEDLHSLRHTRQTCLKKGEAFTNEIWKHQDITKRELASIYRSDLTLLISEVETQLLKEAFNIPESILLTLPFLLDNITKEAQTPWSSFEDRTDFVFIGNGKHAPNVDAVKQLKTTIWPLIKEALPDANLHIYGAYFPQQVLELHQPKEKFLVKGWTKDLEHTLQRAKINLAPLRFGAGLKGKVIDGMQNGTPTITTTIGAEGIPNYGLVYDNPQAFAKAAITAYTDKTIWIQLQKEGLATTNTNFDKEKSIVQLFNTISTLKKTLAKHRNSNFIGQLLQHQTLASSKFMGKWITEKNKKE